MESTITQDTGANVEASETAADGLRDVSESAAVDTCRFPNMLSERVRAGMSREQLADAIGTTADNVRAWEGGAREPRTHELVEMARVFHCTIDYLLGRSPDRL